MDLWTKCHVPHSADHTLIASHCGTCTVNSWTPVSQYKDSQKKVTLVCAVLTFFFSYKDFLGSVQLQQWLKTFNGTQNNTWIMFKCFVNLSNYCIFAKSPSKTHDKFPKNEGKWILISKENTNIIFLGACMQIRFNYLFFPVT